MRKLQFFWGKWPKYFIKRIEQGEDCRWAVIGYKDYFLSINIVLFAFKIRK